MPTDEELARIDKSMISYQGPCFYSSSGKRLGLSHFFYVKLSDTSGFDDLQRLASEYDVDIIGNNSFMPLWYLLGCNTDSRIDALKMANLFYETGLFASSQPDLIEEDLSLCPTNDTFFANQWHLQNTGQNGGTFGIDISACKAWDLTTGCSSVTIAILDTGFELDHPDLIANVHSTSYNTETGSSPSAILGNHGTLVAGVAGASANNNLGVAGVAPNCKLMSISNELAGTLASAMKRAAGIQYAWNNGAAVVNNSWGSDVYSSQITDAVLDAVTYGRAGLGTVVVFSAGNSSSSSLSFPANNSNAISVGAVDKHGQKLSSSNYGSGLDVVAPGSNIYTTDRQGTNGKNPGGDYTIDFHQTSSAAPMISGIAALIISANPNLTQAQVRNIIESTTTKFAGYTYTFGAGENPALTWNNQVGYGRANASQAVERALGGPIAGPEVICSTGTFSMSYTSPGAVTWSSSNVNMLTINSSTGVANRVGSATGTVEIIATMSTACGTSTLKKTVHVGNPIILSATMDGLPVTYPQPCSTASRLAIGGRGIQTYGWTVVDGSIPIWPVSGSPYMCDIGYFYDYARIRARTSNVCGYSDYIFYLIDPNMWLTAYPNPATSELTVQFSDVSNVELLPKTITLFHESSTKPELQIQIEEWYRKRADIEQNKLQLDLRDLPRGIYYLHIAPSEKSGKKTEKLKIILE